MLERRWIVLAAAVAVQLLAARGERWAQAAPVDLDAVAQRMIAQERVAGASVLVVQRGKVVLRKGYGYADLGLEAPARADTTYHVVGPMLPFTGVAVMQLVERGKLSLDDDIAKHVPEFPLQGHRVTVRQLLNHTSGIVDYHYLGDPIEATSRLPKALDEVMALYAGKKWVNEPGKKWDWSISGFQMLVTIVERVSGDSFPDFVKKHIFEPAGVTATTYCDDHSLVRGLSHSYRHFEKSFVPAYENAMAYNADLRFCSTVDDIYQLWKSIGDRKLIEPKTFAMMTAPEGPAAHTSAKDPNAAYGFAMIINSEDGHRRIGQHGSLLGYSGSLYDFPEDKLTIVVLTNTEGQNAFAITRALARAALGVPPLPAPPAPPAERALVDAAVSARERAQLAGTFVLKLQATDGLHDSFIQYRRTYRVFDENGRLMIQALGEGPERLLKQADGSFAVRSQPAGHIALIVQNGRAASMKIEPSPFGVPLAGERVGPGDPQTFHREAR
ncbi:MAG TPA: serine hydrolase domain-containing protein [Kofleriaceae bacterium]|jgi:CubicO group peptidase (beta-lactamase class C family)|nr:serine hydrolase domain-containing protein [Kofleriaceae bacterium]